MAFLRLSLLSMAALIFATLLVSEVEGRSFSASSERTNIFRLRKHGPPPPPPGSKTNSRASEEHFITQKLDHFNILDDKTWQQRYFTSADSYQEGGPVFLFLSGEWEAHPLQVTDQFVGELAAQYGGYMINLEHRFYGKSRPTPDISTGNMKYLHADQALEDAAVFTQTMMADVALNLTGPWIVVGGSYSANLAAWIRARYPHLFFAAYASSGPVLAQLDFFEYYEVVNDALLATSPDCPGHITAAMNELALLMEQGESESITTLFNFCEPVDIANPDNQQYVYMVTAEYFAGEVQYAQSGNLASVCSTLAAGQATPLETLAQLVREGYGAACLVSSYQKILDFYRDATDFSNDIVRQWYYQTCTEYGYYQTLTSMDQPFGQVVPVEFWMKWCSDVYGSQFTREVAEAGIARTNLVNGGLTPDVTRVLYTHGSLDPWHALGIQTDLNADSPVIMIDGESHCRDLGADAADDSQAVKDARVQISSIIGAWLQTWQPKKH